MVIIHQCEKCNNKGKKIYCKDCTKSIDYFDVFKYDNNNDTKYDNKEFIERIEAYTWNDAIEFVKDKYFYENNNLHINCEKEFAYIEKIMNVNVMDNKPKLTGSGYKIYLNKDISHTGSSTVSGKMLK